MKKLIFVLVAAMGLSMTSYAQMSDKEMKKAIKEAQKLVKEARTDMERDDVTNKSGAKKLIDEAIKNDFIKDWDQTWYEAAEIYNYYFREENSKSYTGRADTVAMYNYLDKWFEYALRADSLQQIPNSKGKVSNEVREKMKDRMISNISNFINGGIFYFNNRTDYAQAYKMFDKYFTLAQCNMLKADMDEDETYNQYKNNFAYFPALAAYNLEQWDNSLKYALIAMNDEEYGEAATEFVCESYGNLGDTVNWLKTLKDGLIKYPTVEYYYGKLLNYYTNDMAELESFINEMVQIDPEKAYNYYVLGYIAQQNKEYEKAIAQYNKAIEKDEKMVDAYNNLGLCILQQAADFDNENKVDPRTAAGKKIQAQIDEYYKQALPYYTKLREIAPDAKDKWGIALYNIYYKLKMTNEFNEIEKYLESQNMI